MAGEMTKRYGCPKCAVTSIRIREANRKLVCRKQPQRRERKIRPRG